jgi:hypothetical protein
MAIRLLRCQRLWPVPRKFFEVVLTDWFSEEKVLRLGQPSRQNLGGVGKTIEYRDIGIVVTLTKGRAYMITIKGPRKRQRYSGASCAVCHNP